jgi:hypothetical protein
METVLCTSDFSRIPTLKLVCFFSNGIGSHALVLSEEKVFDVVTEDSPSIKQVIEKFNALGMLGYLTCFIHCAPCFLFSFSGVSYDKYFEKELTLIREGHVKLVNWQHEDFQYVKQKDQLYAIVDGENKAILAKDMTFEKVSRKKLIVNCE